MGMEWYVCEPARFLVHFSLPSEFWTYSEIKRENDVLKDKPIFDSYHVVILYFTICVNLLLPHICHKFGIY